MNVCLGVAAIALIDVEVPALLAAWLIFANVRGHRSSRHELGFSALCLIPLAPLVIFVVQASWEFLTTTEAVLSVQALSPSLGTWCP